MHPEVVGCSVTAPRGAHGLQREGRYLIGVGTRDRTSPLPPNRTGGFPASGFPVSDVPSRGLLRYRACRHQTEQPARRKPFVAVCSSLCSSRCNIRDVHTLRSTHPHRGGASPACLGNGLSLAACSASTAAGLFSVVWVIASSLSWTPWLHGRYPLLSYYESSDFRQAVLRPSEGMNAGLSCRKFPAFLATTSNPSVSNHPPCPDGLFSLHSRFFSTGQVACASTACAVAPSRVLGSAQGFASRSEARPARGTESSSL